MYAQVHMQTSETQIHRQSLYEINTGQPRNAKLTETITLQLLCILGSELDSLAERKKIVGNIKKIQKSYK